MKKIIYILIPLAVAACTFVLPGCKKYNETPSHIAPVSFPVITLLGPADTTINRGATWKDPGASWKDTVTGESGIVYATAVNTGVDSAYVLFYTATNKNGFQAYASRGLGVTNYNGPINLAAGYTVNATNGTPVTITQVSRALFDNPNADGFGGGDNTVIVIKSDSTLSVATIGTQITGTNGVFLPETFTAPQLTFQAPFVYTGNPPRLTAQPATIIQYTVTILNVPPVQVAFLQDLQ